MPGTTSTALPSFSHDQHHKTDAAKRKGGLEVVSVSPGFVPINLLRRLTRISVFCLDLTILHRQTSTVATHGVAGDGLAVCALACPKILTIDLCHKSLCLCTAGKENVVLFSLRRNV